MYAIYGNTRDSWLPQNHYLDIEDQGHITAVPTIDIVPTLTSDEKKLCVSIVNKHPDETMGLQLNIVDYETPSSIDMYWLSGKSKDAYNDVENPDDVVIESRTVTIPKSNELVVEVPPIP